MYWYHCLFCCQRHWHICSSIKLNELYQTDFWTIKLNVASYQWNRLIFFDKVSKFVKWHFVHSKNCSKELCVSLMISSKNNTKKVSWYLQHHYKSCQSALIGIAITTEPKCISSYSRQNSSNDHWNGIIIQALFFARNNKISQIGAGTAPTWDC